jgi:purine catabolism regulator
VPFVQLTEAIQLRLLDERASVAIVSEAVRDRILPTVLQGTSLQGMTDVIAATLECSVIVEGVSGSVLAASGERVADVLRDWTRVSGEMVPAHADSLVRHPSGAASAALVTRGRRWAHVVLVGAPGPAGHQVMLAARSAEALAFQHLLSAPDASWEVEQADAMIGHLLAGSLSADRLRVLARVSGLATGGRTLLPLMVGVMSTPTTTTGAAQARRVPDAGQVIRANIESARTERHLSGLVGQLRGQRVPVVLSLPTREDTEHALGAFADAVCERLRRESFDVSIAVGPECRKVEDLTAGFAGAAHVADAFLDDPQGSRVVRHEDIRLRGLVRLLVGNDDMHAFVTRQLGPLLGKPQLLTVLSSYLATSMNKAATAQLTHLSRPALYRRLDQITALLGVELDDMEHLSALYVALLAHHAEASVSVEPAR